MEAPTKKKMRFPKFTIVYFGMGGRAEPIRLAAAIGKIPFTNKALGYQDFSKERSSFPLKQVPVLEIEEPGEKKVVIHQSMSILRYFGKMAGLYSDDPIEAMKIDTTIDSILDLESPLDLTFSGAVKSLVSEKEWTKEEKLAVRKRILEQAIPKHLGYLEKQIEDNGTGWLVGDGLTIADLKLYYVGGLMIQKGILDGIPATTLDSYPKVKENIEKVKSHPDVAAWYEKYPGGKYSTFDYAP